MPREKWLIDPSELDEFQRKIRGLSGEFADIDHLIPAQTDHRFRGKLTT